jgi:hypothetical protein
MAARTSGEHAEPGKRRPASIPSRNMRGKRRPSARASFKTSPRLQPCAEIAAHGAPL